MDIEYHYWITGIIAKEAGFTEEESKIIAYSSQFVDENDVSLEVHQRGSKEKYVNFVSQTLNILKPKNDLLRIYPIYHFVPGLPDAPTARRKDGKMHLFNTTPNNPSACAFLQEAFKAHEDLRLYRIGIATHAFVDTWAHQNFTGWHESFNALGLNAIPNIGHADAEHHPDWVGHRWEDSRLLEGEVNNNYRFLSASEELFALYCNHLASIGRYPQAQKPEWDKLKKKLLKLMGPVSSGDQNYGHKDRLKAYSEEAPWLPQFNEEDWLKEALDIKVIVLKDSKNGLLSSCTIFKDKCWWTKKQPKENLHWFGFQCAVKNTSDSPSTYSRPTSPRSGSISGPPRCREQGINSFP